MILPWRDVDGVSTSLTANETLRLQALAANKTVLEVGSAYGYSSLKMAAAGARVLAVDPHAGENPRSLDVMLDNIARRTLHDRVHVVVARSENVLPLLAPVFDLAFIDGNHSEDAVACDIRMAWPLLRPGGTLACHDYGEDTLPGPRAALDAWREPDEIVDTLWLARKP